MILPPADGRARGASLGSSILATFGEAALLAGLLLVLPAACERVHRTNMAPLDGAGMSYSSIEELRKLGITDQEVPELVKAKQAGVSDSGCVELVRTARGRKQSFGSGDAVATLRRVGVSEAAVLELARLDQLGFWVGEAQAMRLAGLSDAIILEVARHHAEGKPVLSGAALAELNNTGLSEATLLELAHRGVSDDQAGTIVGLRGRGWSDARILRRYPAQ